SGQTIYNRIASTIRSMYAKIQSLDSAKLLTSTTMTYTANSESLALPSAVKYRPVHTVERQINTGSPLRYDPLRMLTLDHMEPAIRWGELRVLDEDAPWSGYGYYIEQQQTIYVVPAPASDFTLRIRYTAGFTDLVDGADDANVPNLIPEEHHEAIALE